MITTRPGWISASCLAALIWVGVPAAVCAQGSPSSEDSGASVPWNQGVPTDERRAAREIFREGNRLIQIPLFAKAAARYQQAIARWKHPAFYYNLAIAQLNLDQLIAAYGNLKEAIRYGDGPLGKAKYQQALTHIRVLESQLGRIEVSCAIPGARVALDGKQIFVGPGHYQGLVSAGEHQVTASKSGYMAASKQLNVSAGKIGRVELMLLTLDEMSESTRRWRSWKPWAVVGAGTLATVTGVFLHWQSAGNFSDFDTRFLQLSCITQPNPHSPGCGSDDIPAPMSQQLSRAEWQQRIAVTSYVAGGTTILTGLILVYMNRPRLIARVRQERSAQLALSPLLLPQATGVVAGFRF